MKKTLIALAAVAATGAAFAQSSVTLYGVADVALNKTTGTSLQMTSAGTMNNGNSRWGVRGTEDLGGGLKASFNFEQGLDMTNGTLAQSGDGPFGRAAYMALSGGFGEVSLGRRLNPAFYTAAAWELTGTANYSAVTAEFAGVLGGIRENDMIMYTAPAMGGVTVQFAHVLNQDTAGADATNDLSLRYSAGPLVVAFNYNKQDNGASNKHLGARYNFGAFTVGGAWIDPDGADKGYALGVSAPVGPVNLVLDYVKNTEGAKNATTLVEAKYSLSKRTTAYAAYRAQNNGRADQLGLGVRHNF